MSEDKSGLPAALNSVDLGERPPDAEGFEQLPLLPLIVRAKAVEAEGKRGAGRPVGAKNRRTKEWVEYLLSRYRSPLVVLAETYSRGVAELALEIGCKREDAFKLQMEAARALAPYLHQKQPQAIDLGDAALIQLNIFTGSPGDEPVSGDDTVVLEATVIEDESE